MDLISSDSLAHIAIVVYLIRENYYTYALNALIWKCANTFEELFG